MPGTNLEFRPIDGERAWLIVNDEEGVFGLESTVDGDQVHRVGFLDAPRFELVQPWAPDDGWQVNVLRDGMLTADKPVRSTTLARALDAWGSGRRPLSNPGILEVLPTGEYLLVRSNLRPRAVDTIALGNDSTAATPNIQELLANDIVHLAVVGAIPDELPNLGVPLIGVPILNYDGMSFPPGSTQTRQHGILLFSFGSTVDAGSTTPDDLLLVLPATGSLILDNLEGYSESGQATARERWCEEFLLPLAGRIGGGPSHD